MQANQRVVGNAYLNYGGVGCLAHGLVEVPGCFPERNEQQGGDMRTNNNNISTKSRHKQVISKIVIAVTSNYI